MELELDPQVLEALKRIIDYEEKREERFKTNPIYRGMRRHPPFWDWKDVRVPPHVIKKLVLGDLVECLGKKDYVLKDRTEVKRLIEAHEKPPLPAPEIPPPQDLFNIVEGYDDVKEIFKKSISAKRPVHILLVGPPSSAKSLFLMEIERLPRSHFVTSGTSTKAGVRDVLLEEMPRYLILDEIDKVSDARDLSCLLTWMESGRLVVTKHGKREVRKGLGWVFGACNTTKGLPPEVLSRFMVLHFPEYTMEQFKLVVLKVLKEREGCGKELAEHIANKLSKFTKDPRDAVRFARLCSNEREVDNLFDVLKKYRK